MRYLIPLLLSMQLLAQIKVGPAVIKIGPIVVNPPAVLLNYIKVPTQIASLQEAVNRIKAGGTIEITQNISQSAAAVHGRNFILKGSNKDITLTAPNNNSTIFHVANHAQSVTIQNLKLSGGHIAIHLNNNASTLVNNVTIANSDVGIFINERNGETPKLIRLNDVVVRDCHQYGVLARKSILRLYDTVLMANTMNLYAVKNQNLYMRGGRVLLSKGDIGAQIKGGVVTIINSNFAFNLNVGGLELNSVSSANIKDSNFTLNYGAGLRIKHSSNIIINGSFFSNNVPKVGVNCVDTRKSVKPLVTKRVIKYPASAVKEIGGLATEIQLMVPEADLILCNREDHPDFYGMGLFIDDVNNVTINESEMKENYDTGLFIQNSNTVTLTNTTLESNLYAGATVLYSRGIYKNNKIKDNTHFGFQSVAGVSTFEKNEFSFTRANDEGLWGIGLYIDNGLNYVIDNTFNRNDLYGVLAKDDADSSFGPERTNIYGNRFYYGVVGIVWDRSYEVNMWSNQFYNVEILDDAPLDGDPEPSPPPAIPDVDVNLP